MRAYGFAEGVSPTLSLQFSTKSESYVADLMGLKGLGLMKKDEFTLGEYDLLWLK